MVIGVYFRTRNIAVTNFFPQFYTATQGHNLKKNKDSKAINNPNRLAEENNELRKKVAELEKMLLYSRSAAEPEKKEHPHSSDLLPYHSLFENLPLPILIEKEGVILDANKFAVKFFEAKKEKEIIGKPIKDFLFIHDREYACEKLAHIKNSKSPKDCVKARIISLKGTMHTTSIYANTMVYKGNRITQLVFRDITKEQIQKLLLSQSEESYRGVFNSSTDAIYVQGLDGTFIDVNDAVIKMYGYPKSYYIGKTPMDIGAPEKNDPEKLRKNFQAAIEGKIIRFNFWGKRKNGEIFPKIVQLKKGKYFGNKVIFAFATDISDMVKAEQAMIQSEQKYRQLVSNLLVGVYIIQDKVIVFCNKVFAKIYGYENASDMIGKELKELVAPEDYEKVLNESNLRYSGKKLISHYNIKIVRRDGERRDVEIQSSLILYQGKKSIQGTIMDITERLQATEKLIESEKRYRQLFDFLPYGGEVLDTEGYIIDCSPATCKMLGYEPQEMIGQHISKFIDKQARQQFMTLFPLILSGRSVNAEINMINKQGTRLRVLRAAQPIFDKHPNKISKIIALNIDITERVKAEEQLSRLATVVEQTFEAICIMNKDGFIIYANSAFYNMTGYKEEEIINKPYSLLENKEQDKDFYRNMWDTITEGNTWQGTIVNRHKNGRLYYERALIFPIFNVDKEITNYVKIAIDITEEKRREELLKQSQKMEAVGTLAGGIAHDFNNLLTIINGRIQLMMMNNENDEKLSNNLDIVLKTGKRAEKLVSQLLAYSRKQMFEPKNICINEVMDDLEKMLRRLIPENIKIETDLALNLPPIKADPYQLEQILINLCINARDAILAKKDNPDKRITIRTELTMIDKKTVANYEFLSEGYYVVISVSDTGTGFDTSVKERLFDPFFTTKEVGKGTGLGLATVYGIVKQNSANIIPKSNPGEGSTFSIFWPITEGEKVSFSKEEKSNKDLRGEGTVFVVEDDPMVREFTVEILKKSGYTVYQFENGAEVFEHISKNKPQIDVLVTDVIMPELGGTELVDKIKEFIPSERIILVSGYFYNQLLSDNEVTPDTRFLHKPFTMNELLTEVKIIIDKMREEFGGKATE